MNSPKIFLIVFSLACLLSCVQELEPDSLGDPVSLLVVDGAITTQEGPQTVKLTLSKSLEALNEPSPPVSGAEVSVSDGSRTWHFTENEPGIYQSAPSMQGKVGETYSLTIVSEGKTYTASEKLYSGGDFDEELLFHPPPDPDYKGASFAIIDHQFGFDEPHQWEVIVDDTAYYRPSRTGGDSVLVEVASRTFTYYTHPLIEPNGLFTFSPTNYYGYPAGLGITFRRLSISGLHYRYLRALFSETEWRGGLFDTPPGNLPTNLEGGAIGYFAAREVVEKRYRMPDL